MNILKVNLDRALNIEEILVKTLYQLMGLELTKVDKRTGQDVRILKVTTSKIGVRWYAFLQSAKY